MPRDKRVDPRNLRDHGRPERVARLWRRVQSQLKPMLRAHGAHPRRDVARRAGSARIGGALAALVVMFGAGLHVGRLITRPSVPSAAGAPTQLARTALPPLIIAGSTATSFSLPGGGALTLSPGTIVERLRQDDGAIELGLVVGQAELTWGAERSPALSMLVGSDLVRVAGAIRARMRDNAETEILVLSGAASVLSPDDASGLRRLVTGERASRQAPVTSVEEASSARPPPRPAGPPVAHPVSSSAASDEPTGALTALRRACEAQDAPDPDRPGARNDLVWRVIAENGLPSAERMNAFDLMCVADAAHGRDPARARDVLRRVAEDGAGSEYAAIAAYRLAAEFERVGARDEARRYFERCRATTHATALRELAGAALARLGAPRDGVERAP